MYRIKLFLMVSTLLAVKLVMCAQAEGLGVSEKANRVVLAELMGARQSAREGGERFETCRVVKVASEDQKELAAFKALYESVTEKEEAREVNRRLHLWQSQKDKSFFKAEHAVTAASLGFLFCARYPSGAWGITHLFVAPEDRRRGVGSILVKAISDYKLSELVRDWGEVGVAKKIYSSFRCSVIYEPETSEAQEFFKNLGFGRSREKDCLSSEVEDMEKNAQRKIEEKSTVEDAWAAVASA